MGMFDRLYDAGDNEWQTKAFGNILDAYRVGDIIRHRVGPTYQFEILGGPEDGPARESYGTVRANVLVAIDERRDESIPLLDYRGDVAR